MLVNVCVATLKCHCFLGSSDSKISLDEWCWGGNKLCTLMVNCTVYIFPSMSDVPISVSFCSLLLPATDAGKCLRSP